MGGYYARAQGHPDAVADAIRDHYKPAGQGDDVPTAPVTVAVSLADKLNDLATYFTAGEQPTGSKDPFALRRACLNAIRLIQQNGLRLSIGNAISLLQRELPRTFLNGTSTSYEIHPFEFSNAFDPNDFNAPWGARFAEATGAVRVIDAHVIDDQTATYKTLFELPSPYQQRQQLLDFFADRLKVQQREAGVRHDLIDAVFALGGEDDLVRLLARVKALQSFVTTDEGKNLLAGYKRAANILKKSPLPEGRGDSPTGERGRVSDPRASEHPHPLASGASRLPLQGEGKLGLSYTPEPEEHALINALDSAEPLATAAIEREDFEGAMAALASLRAPIDAFFETVTVNDPDPAKRDARLALLARVRDAVHRVADFSKIEG
jgi:glycyl-tRNA synthetase beta chain